MWKWHKIWMKIRGLGRWLWRRGNRFTRLRAAHLRLGRRGEDIACHALGELGYDILERNVRNKYGEIDIIARNGGCLCFVEVKTRHANRRWRPADAVDAVRRGRLARAAHQFMRKINASEELPYRFDIMEVIFEQNRLAAVNHLKDAFKEPRHKKAVLQNLIQRV